MAFSVSRFRLLRSASLPMHSAVSVGANARRASITPRGYAASPLTLVYLSASSNGAVREVIANFPSPRFARNVSLPDACSGPAIMTVHAHYCVARAVRDRGGLAVGSVARGRFGRLAQVSAALSPNLALNRTPAGVAAPAQCLVGAG